MGDFPLVDGQGTKFISSATVTPSATANTYGPWAQLSAALPFDVAHLRSWPFIIDAGAMRIQFGIGAAAAEAGVVEVVTHQPAGVSSYLSPQLDLPVAFPRGARFVCRGMFIAGSASSFFPDCLVFPVGSMLGQPQLQRATVYGATNTATTTITTGATNNPGAWTPLVASTTNPIRNLAISMLGAGAVDALLYTEIAVGAAGSEVVIGDRTYWYSRSSPASHLTPAMQTLPLSVPAGQRLSMRMTAPNLAGTYSVSAHVIGFD